MPKEQPSLDEHSPRSTLSKNAKDKSNNTALLAIRDTTGADDSSRRGSHCSSEKDSGFSDGSDWQQADVEDQQRNKSQSRAGENGETSQNQEHVQRNSGSPPVMPEGHHQPPTYIKDMMLKQQPGEIRKRGQLLWKNSIKGISHSGSPQMILFQQPGLLPATFQLPKPSSRKFNVAGQKIPGSYLPILNSYPRIAPHPSKKSPDKFSSIHESQNLNKRACTEQKSEDPAVTKGLPERHLHKQPKLAVSAAGVPCSSPPRDRLSASSPTTASMSQRSPSESSQDTSYSLFTTSSVGLHRHATASIRHRRFLNTVKILRQSGLLDITLRTKELMRQSNATQRDLTQLRQHTELLCQAASNPSINLNGVTVWEHLYRAMAKSGSYPNLKVLQNFQTSSWPDSASPPESISKGDTNGPQAVAQQQRQPKQDGKLKAGETSTDRVSFTPPDSSTG
ncbi:CLOCK-interacting pacemaker isoform X1 [Archocentrus centrarchus]|uniref:CLOCK-interacting pacemaker isoform X1 n=1 Tax=Archocentrus centrarchus TaxID=63155 RepID=UPI0011E9C5F0|nr:CLOCK-interacting pacemaker-like isoform X1 [Archocentrus centrarchus]XP_030599365.1 CLOCK-interacting pacemaker-like isoform X1 [Archocentrus centrarchus]XP_030599367.1 CLOCK-interacting pacemaker-like isoform X1 [Archocentrus centrarchus]XP_030599368.1 CLOCK-interacting pacemaker-like isoform X1 [Archocentrus centrarchus]XP_030599369.1 CLOCK-interacting pacemaker-like isoform X1 [Archocentrus centrarchus]